MREEIIRQRDALEASTRDPSKYSSRSAADAAKVREEAELKSKIDRKLPANEKRLDELLRQWNENHGERFVYEGVDYLIKIKSDNEKYKKHIEELKRIKKNQRMSSSSSSSVRRHNNNVVTNNTVAGSNNNNINNSNSVPSRMTKSLSSVVTTSTTSTTMLKSTVNDHVPSITTTMPTTTPKAEKRKLDTIFEKSGSSPIPHKIAATESNKELGNIDENEK